MSGSFDPWGVDLLALAGDSVVGSDRGDLRSDHGALDAAHGRRALVQSLQLRLLTPRGDLARLGRPDYGSRLHELLGEPDTAATRGLARLFVRQALLGDADVAAVGEVQVASPRRGVLTLSAAVQAVTGERVEVGLDVALDLLAGAGP